MVDLISLRSLPSILAGALGVFICLLGLAQLAAGGIAIVGGVIWIATGILLIPQVRQPLYEVVEKFGGPDLSRASTVTLVVVMGATVAVGLVAGGLVVGISSSGSNDAGTPTPTPSGTPVPTTSPTDSATATQTPTPTSTASPTPAPTPTPTSTSTPTPTPTQTPSPTPSTTPTPTPTPDPDPQTAWTVTVTRVVDGDTLEVRYSNGTTETVRLLGVDTPETYGSVDPTEWEGIPDDSDGRQWLQGWGENATSYAEQRLGGEQIYMEVDSEADKRGSYGRLLVYVSQSQYSTTSFNYRLLENGYARLYESTFTESSNFASAESAAMNGEVGVWGYSPPEPSGSGSVQIANIHEDAAGAEYDNLDDEYVTLENTGSSAVDMTGWTLSDADGNTYTFPDGYALEGDVTIRVITGSDSDPATLDWGQEAPVWNNGGDTATLKDDTDQQVDQQSYN